MRGCFRKFWLDFGINFVGVKFVLEKFYKFFDRLNKFEFEVIVVKYGIEWLWKIYFVDFFYRNGVVEVVVKVVKRVLSNFCGDGVFIWGEF